MKDKTINFEEVSKHMNNCMICFKVTGLSIYQTKIKEKRDIIKKKEKFTYDLHDVVGVSYKATPHWQGCVLR